MQICDTQSYYDKITYPIISNQKSVPFSFFIINLCAEVANAALLDNRLFFKSFYTRFKEKFYRLRHVPDFIHYDSKKDKKLRMDNKIYLPFSKKKKCYRLALVDKQYYVKCAPKLQKRAQHKRTYIYNIKRFRYGTKEIVLTTSSDMFLYSKEEVIMAKLKEQLLTTFIKKMLWSEWFAKLTKKSTRSLTVKGSLFRSNTYFSLTHAWGKNHFNLGFPMRIFLYRELLKLELISLIGLKKMFRRKYFYRRRFLTTIPIFAKDFHSRLLYAYLCHLNTKKFTL